MKSFVLFKLFDYFEQFFMSEGKFLSGHQEAQIAWSSVVFCVNIQFPSKARDAGPLVAVEDIQVQDPNQKSRMLSSLKFSEHQHDRNGKFHT